MSKCSDSNTCNHYMLCVSNRCQDGCDNDSEEDKEKERKVAASHESCSCDLEKMEEVLMPQGTLSVRQTQRQAKRKR